MKLSSIALACALVLCSLSQSYGVAETPKTRLGKKQSSLLPGQNPDQYICEHVSNLPGGAPPYCSTACTQKTSLAPCAEWLKYMSQNYSSNYDPHIYQAFITLITCYGSGNSSCDVCCVLYPNDVSQSCNCAAYKMVPRAKRE